MSEIDVLIRNNVVICSIDELIEGKQVEFDDPTIPVYTNHEKCTIILRKAQVSTALQVLSSENITQSNGVNRPRATILKKLYGWRCLFRFQDEVNPRQREIDLSTLKYFKVLHHLPMIYHLDSYISHPEPRKSSLPIQSFAKRLSDRGDDSELAHIFLDKHDSPVHAARVLQSKKSISKADPFNSYDYYADTYGIVTKGIRESMHFATLTNASVNNRYSNCRGGAAKMIGNCGDGDELMIDDAVDNLDVIRGSAEAIERYQNPSTKALNRVLSGMSSTVILPDHPEIANVVKMSGSYRRNVNNEIVGLSPLPANQRYMSDYAENIFESHAIGIGAAKKLEEDAKRAELKRKQWEMLVEERRRKIANERRQKIEEEEKKASMDAVSRHREDASRKKREDNEDQLKIIKLREEEARKWDVPRK